jgi:hypothetical protein
MGRLQESPEKKVYREKKEGGRSGEAGIAT